MTEVKKAGKYQTNNGKEVEIYGFDTLGGGPVLAEGFLTEDRNLKWWNPENGELRFHRTDDSLDIARAL